MRSRLWVMPTVGALLTLPCTAFVLGDSVPPEPKTMQDLEAFFEREMAVYTDAGLREVESGTARFGDEIPITLEGGQCVGVVTASEAAWPAIIRLRPRDERETLTTSDHAHVASVAWCDPYWLPLRVSFDGDWQSSLPPTAQSLEGTIHYRIFTGRTDAFDLRNLPRGEPNEARRGQVLARMESERAAIAERAELPQAEPLLPPVQATTDAGALLVPRSDATWTTYRRAITRFLSMSIDDAHPRVHDSSIGPIPDRAMPSSEAIVSVDDDGAELWRVLAVVDPADLPVEGRVPCATVRFGRLGPEGVDVRRWDLVEAHPISVSGIAASDSVCPGDPIRLYIVPIADTYEYVVRFFAADEPSAPRQTSPALPSPPYTPLLEAVAACEERGERCFEAGRELRDGVHVPVDEPRARALLREACARDVSTCAEYAEHLLDRSDEALAREAASVLRRACDEDRWDACARLGDLRRLGRGSEADYDDAHALYRAACTNGLQDACRNANALEILGLLGATAEATRDDDAPDDVAPDDTAPDDDALEGDALDDTAREDDATDEPSELDAEDPSGVATDE